MSGQDANVGEHITNRLMCGMQLMLCHASCSAGQPNDMQRMQVGSIPLSRFNIQNGDEILVTRQEHA